MLTATRSGEVRGAQWAEIDATERVWTLSAQRMKAKREHRVPLCGRALEILDAARALGDGSPHVFPMRSRRPISASTLLKLLNDLRIAAVPHGFRSSFRDWAAEKTDHPREVIEAALAHVRPEQGRGSLRPFGPVRAPAAAHGRLVGVPRWRARTGDGAAPVAPAAYRPAPPSRRWWLGPKSRSRPRWRLCCRILSTARAASGQGRAVLDDADPRCRAHQHDRVLAGVKARRLSVYHWLDWALGWPNPAAPLARRRRAGGGRTVRVAGRRGS